MRQDLTSALAQGGTDDELTKVLQHLRAVCREFLDMLDPDSTTETLYAGLRRLRPEFAWGVAWMAVRYGIDVDDDLAQLLAQYAPQ